MCCRRGRRLAPAALHAPLQPHPAPATSYPVPIRRLISRSSRRCCCDAPSPEASSPLRPVLPSSPSPPLSRFHPLPCTNAPTSVSTTASSDATSASTAASADAFSVDDYLRTRCNLYPNVAARMAPELSAVKLPSKPDAVRAFLASALEVSPPLIAVAVARDPTIFTCSVPRTLAPHMDELRALGFTTFQMGLLVARCGAAVFRSRELISRVQFWLPYLRGRVDKLVGALKGNPGLLSADLWTVRSTIALLQEEGAVGAAAVARQGFQQHHRHQEEDFVAKIIRPFLVRVPNLAKIYEAAVVKKEAQ